MKTWQKIAISVAVIGVTGTIGVFVVAPWIKKKFFSKGKTAEEKQGEGGANAKTSTPNGGSGNVAQQSQVATQGRGSTVGGPRSGATENPRAVTQGRG